MFWLGGLAALEVATSTPDALCPSLEEARDAIAARVGEVRGDYRAEFALVRAADGRQVLALTVREGEQQVLTRELPLDDGGCRDAAQTIAHVLERYFDAVEKPVSASNPEPIPAIHDERPTPTAPAATAPDNAPPPAEPSPPRTWRAHAGFVYDLELGVAPTVGVAHFPRAFRWTRRLELGVALDVAPFLSRLQQTVREQEISAFSVQGALSLPLVWHFAPWSASVGPWAQLRLQRAEAKALTHEQSAYRVVPGLGGVAQLAWSPTTHWTLGVGVAGGVQTSGAAARYVLQTADDGPKPVLVPETWFGQGQLTLALDL